LAALVLQLIQFQEDNLGKNVSKPPLTRLPVSFVITSVICHQLFILCLIADALFYGLQTWRCSVPFAGYCVQV